MYSKLVSDFLRVLRCLMQHLDSPEMPTACEAALLEIQYFIARDWRMDPALYAACSENAERLCGARRSWFNVNTSDPEGGGKRRFESEGGKKSKVEQVLPCLFRYVYHPSPKLRVSVLCLFCAVFKTKFFDLVLMLLVLKKKGTKICFQ